MKRRTGKKLPQISMKNIIKKVLQCVSVGTSVGTVAGLILKALKTSDAIMLLGIGLVSLSIGSLIENKE